MRVHANSSDNATVDILRTGYSNLICSRNGDLFPTSENNATGVLTQLHWISPALIITNQVSDSKRYIFPQKLDLSEFVSYNTEWGTNFDQKCLFDLDGLEIIHTRNLDSSRIIHHSNLSSLRIDRLENGMISVKGWINSGVCRPTSLIPINTTIPSDQWRCIADYRYIYIQPHNISEEEKTDLKIRCMTYRFHNDKNRWPRTASELQLYAKSNAVSLPDKLVIEKVNSSFCRIRSGKCTQTFYIR